MKDKLKIKGIKIDVRAKTVYEVELTDELSEYYRILECSTIERLGFDNKNDLILDEDGLQRQVDDIGGFALLGSFFVGHGLLVGNNGGENWISHSLDISLVRKAAYFFD